MLLEVGSNREPVMENRLDLERYLHFWELAVEVLQESMSVKLAKQVWIFIRELILRQSSVEL